jgi:uncharacterized protein involved in outer membrane biogenesis
MRRAIRRTLWGVAAALGIAIAVPFVVPVSHFIPELTRLASKELGQPVAMEDLRLHLLPSPRIVGHRISVGRRGQVAIGELEIQPDLASLVSGTRAVRLIRANRVVLDSSALVLPRAMPKRQAGESLLVRRIVLTTVKVKHPELDLPLFDVDLQLAEGMQLREARFETQDAGLKLRVKPVGGEGFSIALDAGNWTVPVGAPLAFEALSAQGTLKGDQLRVEPIEGALYGGKVAGMAHVEWGTDWQLAGKAQLAGVDLVPLQKALGKSGKLSGRLYADAVFSARAGTPAALRDGLVVEGPFEVSGGVYAGVDLARASEWNGEAQAGDATTFEELRGRLELRDQRVRLRPLCMRSPQLVAAGNVEIAPDKSVSGKLDISVAQTGGILGIPVRLGGTTDHVTMRPSKGYLIGAAIGTAILPGIGTSIGSTLGGRIGTAAACN